MAPKKKSVRNPNKVKDFKKVKSKLGKGKRPAANATVTEFRSRSIHLPEQQIKDAQSVSEQHVAVTFRRLSLAELLEQTNHYNIKMRKQALDGLSELVCSELGRKEICSSLGSVLDHLWKIVRDEEEQDVRVKVFTCWMKLLQQLKALPDGYGALIFQSHTAKLSASLRSSLSHSVRFTRSLGIKMLFGWLQYFPDLVFPHYPKLMPIMINLLNLTHENVTYSSLGQSLALVKMADIEVGRFKHKPKASLQLRTFVLAVFYKFLHIITHPPSSKAAKILQAAPETPFSTAAHAAANQTVKVNDIVAQTQPIHFIDQNDHELCPFQDILDGSRQSTVTNTSSASMTSTATLNVSAYGKKKVPSISTIVEGRGSEVDILSGREEIFFNDLEDVILIAKNISRMLIQHWMECLPGEYPSTPANSVSMSIILDLLIMIFDHLQSLNPPADLFYSEFFETHQLFQRHIFLFFPYAEKNTSSTTTSSTAPVPLALHSETYESMVEAGDFISGWLINYSVCELMSFFSPFASESASPTPTNTNTSSSIADSSPWRDSSVPASSQSTTSWLTRVVHYYEETFQSNKPLTQMLLKPFRRLLFELEDRRARANETELKTIDGMKAGLLLSFSELFQKTHPQSSLKRECVAFMSDVMETLLMSNTGDEAQTQNLLEEVAPKWMETLPKLLWQLGDRQVETSRLILSLMQRFCRFGSRAMGPVISTLSLSLVPFLFMQAPARPPASKGKEMYGPFVRLPSDLQSLSLDLMYYLDSFSDSLLKGLIACSRPSIKLPGVAQPTSIPTSTLVHLMEIIHSRRSTMTLSAFLSFFFSLLSVHLQPGQQTTLTQSAVFQQNVSSTFFQRQSIVVQRTTQLLKSSPEIRSVLFDSFAITVLSSFVSLSLQSPLQVVEATCVIVARMVVDCYSHQTGRAVSDETIQQVADQLLRVKETEQSTELIVEQVRRLLVETSTPSRSG